MSNANMTCDQRSAPSDTFAADRPARSVIVVGGGTAGAVLAARLSEDPLMSVTLLESGATDNYGAEVRDPRRAHEVWSTLANSTVTTMAHPKGVIPMVLGNVMGGTSAVNYLATIRGQPQDYDGWEQAGLDGWGWRDVRQYFIAAENDLDFPDAPIHGNRGPLSVSRWRSEENSTFQRAFSEGLREIGVPSVDDVNDPDQLPGIGAFPATLDSSRQRLTVSTAYLTEQVRGRANLTLRPNSPVSTIIIEGAKAVGVNLECGETLMADEVIVSAGAIGSPTLLMRSGIGPRAELEARGIAVHADLPVGLTMSDHLGTALRYHHDGPTEMLGGPAQTVLVGSSNGREIDYHVFPSPSPDLTRPGDFLLLAYVLKSTGQGRVELAQDPQAPPVVTAPPMPTDVDIRLGHAFQRIADWEQSSAFRDFGCRPAEPHELASPTAVEDALARVIISYGHMVGTCPMGQVLDSECQVRGVSGLRVVDASAMPTIPAGNTYLGCVMVAERVSAMMTAANRASRRN
ncbi:GMC family oxidoreductase [Mycobacterium sp. shizuoka-1]|uniref:GMC family oxidoreductase n=1 Tax=Mycobacterium sp. shizuoka-1 TaxID=2039281 RepID=UPI000C06259E|nr:GMC family oxidoreductase N-terminal domain-containing protein [Mycobacterium sp. shizuoka-1]GAY17676.1 choline dehydrogenase [Mycobacterium sp. shizuoka-1]